MTSGQTGRTDGTIEGSFEGPFTGTAEAALLAQWVQVLAPSCPPARHAALVRALQRYLDLLSRWNTTYNLTAVRDRAAMLRLHLADCLAVVEPTHRTLSLVHQHPASQPLRLLDVGSGGGLPGIVLALALPDIQVTCLDAVAKKVAFVRQAAAELGLTNLHAVQARIETWRAPPFDLITARAFATLAGLTSLSHHLLQPAGAWMAMKGQTPADEIAALPASLEVFHVEQLQVPDLDARRCLVWIRQRPSIRPPSFDF